jgi:ABC-2 type transport system permease protein
MNLFTIEPLIFKNDDNDLLFSYPLSRHQILFSKLFNVYLKNMFFVAIVMFTGYLSFYNQVGTINDTKVLMGFLITLVIPFIPIVLATIIAYFNDYLKFKHNNNYVYKIIKCIFIIFVVLGFFLLFKDVQLVSLNQFFEVIFNKLSYIYPLLFVFYNAIKTENIFFFLLLLIIPIVVIYIYTLVISNNYLKICSLLKGVKKKEEFKYNKTLNYGRLGGLLKKEFLNMLNNKSYLISSFGVTFLITIILFVLFRFIDVKQLLGSFDNHYIRLYTPILLGVAASFGCSTISAMSLEKENIKILRTLPISISKILLSKWLVNVMVNTIFVIINGIIIVYYMKFDIWDIAFSFIVPIFVVMTVSLTGLLFDYRFVEKNEMNDNYIIKQRLITIVPMVLSLILGIIIFIFPIYSKYKLLLGCYIFILIIIMFVEIIYMLINNKKLIRGLFY